MADKVKELAEEIAEGIRGALTGRGKYAELGAPSGLRLVMPPVPVLACQKCGGETRSKVLVRDKWPQVFGYTCKSCGHKWKEEHDM